MIDRFVIPFGKTLTLRTAGKYVDQDLEIATGYRLPGGALGSMIGLRTAGPHEVFLGRCFADDDGAVQIGTFTVSLEIKDQKSLLEQVAKAVRYKAAGNIDLDPELTEQDALISNILTTLARKLPSKT